jgi:cellulose synthase/poly-beta-1,6-N-acetylglucosamine synthase-like glycosyltransferase
MRISLLVPCYNEETAVAETVRSCLKQTRPFDEIIFVNDCSTDRTPEILRGFKKSIKVISTPRNTGNKSSAQEFGLRYITGDIVVTTDADTLLDERFAEEVERSFRKYPKVVAVAGCVKSLPYNWLTLCRAFDYAIGQNIHKQAQHCIRSIFVMPGAASAFRVSAFRKYITFDHDTITEDLDFTYKLHWQRLAISYNPKAISYTQDPATLTNYINQMRRWFGGGWQNLVKHYRIIPTRPIRALELSLIYAEGIIFSALLFILPILNPWFGIGLLAGYLFIAWLFAIWAAWCEKRLSLILVPIPYILIIYINAYIYLEQFVKEVLMRKKNLIWFKPDRVIMPIDK